MGARTNHLPIPPREIQLWVGAFDRDEDFISTGQREVDLMVDLAGLGPETAVLDVGCGCGRVARALTEFLSPRARYFGFDVARESIAWCQREISSRFPAFVFAHEDVLHPVYNPEGTVHAEQFRFPCAEEDFDLVLLSSVFTHLLPAEAEAYTRESVRVLRPGGHLLVSHHLMDEAARGAMAEATTVFEFRYAMGPIATLDPEEPLVGLAYEPAFAERLLTEQGLSVTERRRGDWREAGVYISSQDWLCAVKAG